MSTAELTLAQPAPVDAVSQADSACTHCGLPVPAGAYDPTAARQFCCAGCHTAFEILNEYGLGRYYAFSERRNEAVRSSGRRFDEFDHPTFRELYVRALPDGLSEVELYLEGVHCASCVWLVERVPLIVSGVLRAELDVRRSLARVVWDASVPLSHVARSLDALGYSPHPFRGVERAAMRRKEDRAMLVRIGIAGAVGKRDLILNVSAHLRDREPVPDLWLCAAPIKKGRIDWVAEKACELGVARLVPVLTRRTIIDRLNLDRLRSHMIEAAEQCDRTSLPQLAEAVKLDALLRDWPAGRALFFADEMGGGPAAEAMAAHQGPAAILIGPEGGFDEAVREAIRALPQAVGIGLGPRILRAETAAAAAVTIWMSAAGDW